MKLTLEDKKRAIKLWKSGYGSYTIDKELNVGATTIKCLIEKYQIHGNKILQEKESNRKYTADFKLMIIKRVENGESINSIANEYMEYYNKERIKTKLKGLSPYFYRQQSLNSLVLM